MKTFFSIIIPVFNAEKYLCQNINAILSQTFRDFELLLIDDGSTDGSGTICDEYAERDSRIRVIHKENGGVGSARNVGLKNATGKWIAFVDADDRVEPNLLQKAIDAIGDNDIFIFSFRRWNYRTDEVRISPISVAGNRECKEYMYSLKESWRTSEFFCFPWLKIYRTDMLRGNDIFFPEDITMREDEIFAYRYLPYVKSIVTIDDVLYAYNDEPTGLSAKRLQSDELIKFANYLIKQSLCDCSDKSKTILLSRAMMYFENAMIASWSLVRKYAIAKQMMAVYNHIAFELDDGALGGIQSRGIFYNLQRASIIDLIIHSFKTQVRRWIKIYILHDENEKRWGTNV